MRVLLSIGCDLYDHAGKLNGAERDAQRMFDALVQPRIGDYDPNRSRLLLSPSYDEVRQVLRDALFTDPQPDTFTLFFAGHGSVSAGAFYMWLRDSNPKGLSASALSLADIFRNLNEAAPGQSNIIIDACESGGLIEDLGVLLKPSLLGNAHSPGLTLVATAAQDQGAGDTPAGGAGTIALLDCIEGRDFVQDHKANLDLIEIGMKVSQRLRRSGQNPVVWGLNLFGASGFCKNPRFGSDPASSLRHALHTWPAGSDEVIKRNYDELWTAYSAVGGVWDPGKFSSLVRAMLLPSASDPEVMASLAERLAITFLQRATQSRDPFRSVEVAATLAVALLPALGHQLVAETAQRLVDDVAVSLVGATAALVKDLESDKYALLSDRSGVLSELHELPVRVTKVLGWSAAATAICRDATLRAEAETLHGRLTRLILAHYSGSVASFSDAQAAGCCVALSTCTRLGLREEGKQLVGLLFNSLIQCEGKVARGDLPRDRALDYLIARRQNDYSDSVDLVARPVDLLTVLLKAAVQLGLEDVFDESLWRIDGLAFSAYLPADYVKFGDRLMEGGENLVWSIGYDVFKTADFVASWPAPKTSPKTPLVASLAIAASLLYPDRQAWFLLES